MRLTLDSALLTRLSHLVSGLAQAGLVPGVDAVRIDAQPETLTLSTTDLDTSIRVQGPLQGEVEPGVIGVPAKAFDAFLRTLPIGPVTLRLDGPRLRAEAGRTKASWAAIPKDGLPETWMPIEEAVEYQATLENALLLGALDRTLHAVATNSARPAFTGLYIEGSDQRLKLTATDGGRLAHAPLKVDGAGTAARIVPADGWRAVQRVLTGVPGTCRLTLTPTFLDIDAGALRIRTKTLADSGFPDYGKMLRPPSPCLMVTVGRIALSRAVTRMKQVGRDLRLHASAEGLLVSAEDAEASCEDLIEATLGAEPQDHVLQVGAAFFADTLDAIADDDVVLRWGADPATPAYASDPSFPDTVHMLARRK